MRLLHHQPSPFSRMIRILSREWALDLEEEELPEFPLPERIHIANPMGQVPVLLDGDDVIFPTFLIIETLAPLAGVRTPVYDPQSERQPLMAVLQMGDALVSAYYHFWAGFEQSGPNRLGFDPIERNLERVQKTLDWLAPRISSEISVPGVALAALLLWAESRKPIDHPVPEALERLVQTLRDRSSFAETEPRPWAG